MVYDPYGAFGRGLLGGLDYIARFRQIQQEGELAPLRKEFLLMNLERMRQETEERKALPGILSRISQARYQPPGAEDIGMRVPAERAETEVPAGMSLDDLNRQMRGARTYEEVMQAVGPQEFAVTQRIAPYALEGLVTREQHAEAERKKGDLETARRFGETGWAALKEGRVLEGLSALGQAQMLMGQKPDTQELATLYEKEQDKTLYDNAVKRIGPLGEKAMMHGDREAAAGLMREAYALPPSLHGLRDKTLGMATDVLKRTGDPGVADALSRYHAVNAKVKDPWKAWQQVEREMPAQAAATKKGRMLPSEVDVALKRAGQRPTADTRVKTLQDAAIQYADSASKRHGLTGEQRLDLLAFAYGAIRDGIVESEEDLAQKLNERIQRYKPAAPPEPGPAPRPAPGRQAPQASPPPRAQSRDAILAEAQRLSALGLTENQIRAAMMRAGWRLQRAAEPTIGP